MCRAKILCVLIDAMQESVQAKSITNPLYTRDKLSKTWSQESYNKYENNSKTWKWHHFPRFNDNDDIFEKRFVVPGDSILEIGCASGGAHEFLKNNNAIDAKTDYTGLDISDKGISDCKRKFPDSQWEQCDITRHVFNRRYDFCFERIAVHHMEDPLKVFDNLASITNKSLSATFVSCLNGTTISDLNIARYRHQNGEVVYFNIINPLEVCEILLDHGFRHFELFIGGVHEKVYSNPIAHQYLSPDVNFEKRMIGRTTIIATKNSSSKISTVNYRFPSNKPQSPFKYLRSFLSGRIAHTTHLQSLLNDFEIRDHGVVCRSKYYD